MGKSLVIVESPAKARTIAGYLGDGYVRRVERRPRPRPSERRRTSRRPQAQALRRARRRRRRRIRAATTSSSPEKKKIISELKKQLADADELLLATDEDREGEAIAWHLVQVLKPKVPVRRMVFHEITKDAITRALERHAEHRRAAGRRAGDAPDPRPPLRLRGLARAVEEGHAAGSRRAACSRSRHASSCERERERMAFRSAEYWDLLATFDPGRIRGSPRLRSTEPASRQGRDFVPTTGELARERRRPARRGAAPVRSRRPRRLDVRRPLRRRAAVPAQAGRAVPHCDAPAGGEPEAPLLRTDDHARRSAPLRSGLHHVHADRFDDTLRVRRSPPPARRSPSSSARTSSRRSRAVRASGRERPGGARGDQAGRRQLQNAERAGGRAQRDELALYDLVWKRTLASQMEDARGQTVSLRIGATSADGEDVEFGASGTVITFRGFLAAYEPGKDEPTGRRRGARPPAAHRRPGDRARLARARRARDLPPARYTEPTLVRALEERGIGRPRPTRRSCRRSLDRGYVFKKGTALVPPSSRFRS